MDLIKIKAKKSFFLKRSALENNSSTVFYKLRAYIHFVEVEAIVTPSPNAGINLQTHICQRLVRAQVRRTRWHAWTPSQTAYTLPPALAHALPVPQVQPRSHAAITATAIRFPLPAKHTIKHRHSFILLFCCQFLSKFANKIFNFLML